MLLFYHMLDAIGMCSSCASTSDALHVERMLELPTFPWSQSKTNVRLQAVNEFQSLVSQVQKSSSMVEKVVYSIIKASLVKDPAVQGTPDVMDLQELYDHLERFRLEVCHFAISLVYYKHSESTFKESIAC